MRVTCQAKIEDLWEDKVTEVVFGAGDISKSNHRLISDSASKHRDYNTVQFCKVLISEA